MCIRDRAKGAVIDEVIPDAKRPIPKKYIAKFPYKGSNPLARSITPFTSLLFTEAAVIMIERDTRPPIRIEKKLSNLATFNLFIEFHFSETKDEWRKRLYGTTVVPIKPKMIVKLFESIFGVMTPLISALISGLVIIAVIKKDILIIKTRKTSDLSNTL